MVEVLELYHARIREELGVPRVEPPGGRDGGVSSAATVTYPELAAAAPFYGRLDVPEDVPNIKATLIDPNFNSLGRHKTRRLGRL